MPAPSRGGAAHLPAPAPPRLPAAGPAVRASRCPAASLGPGRRCCAGAVSTAGARPRSRPLPSLSPRWQGRTLGARARRREAGEPEGLPGGGPAAGGPRGGALRHSPPPLLRVPPRRASLPVGVRGGTSGGATGAVYCPAAAAAGSRSLGIALPLGPAAFPCRAWSPSPSSAEPSSDPFGKTKSCGCRALGAAGAQGQAAGGAGGSAGPPREPPAGRYRGCGAAEGHREKKRCLRFSGHLVVGEAGGSVFLASAVTRGLSWTRSISAGAGGPREQQARAKQVWFCRLSKCLPLRGVPALGPQETQRSGGWCPATD